MDIMSQFNLPKYVKGKSFSEASALIAKKFKDRNDPESIATLNDLQGRLQQAQEYVKSVQEARTKPQHQMPDGSMMDGAFHQEGAPAEAQAPAGLNEGAVPSGAEQLANKFEGGGFAKSVGGKGFQEGASSADLMGSMGAGLGAVGALAGMGKQAFGDPGIDTSGATAAPDVPSAGGTAASGALSGAAAGASFGPWGAVIGGALGGISGLIGGGKAQKAAQEARVNHTFAEQNEASNSYKKGGKLVANMFETGNPIDFQDENNAAMNADRTGQPYVRKLPTRQTAMNLSGLQKGIDTSIFNGINNAPKASDAIIPKRPEETTTDSTNYAEMLRYAPAAMNMAQLAGLKRPGQVGLDRLGNRYNEQRVDERGIQNAVQESVGNNRNAILSSAGGSASAARAALLGSQRIGGKALSDAYQSAGAENRQEARAAQKFNLGVDTVNVQQSNQEKNLNLEQQAGYQSNKSKLLSQIGSDLGGVGKEELLKRYPGLMGSNYDWRGKHKSKTKDKKKKKTD